MKGEPVTSKPNCYDCIHRRNIPGDSHLACANREAKVSGDAHGIRRGWFFWPLNFDPTWLLSCDGFELKAAPGEEPRKETP